MFLSQDTEIGILLIFVFVLCILLPTIILIKSYTPKEKTKYKSYQTKLLEEQNQLLREQNELLKK